MYQTQRKKKQKGNPKSFTCFWSLRGKTLRGEFRTHQRGVEACRDFQAGEWGGAGVTSVSPRYWEAAWEDRARRAAGRGRRPSRLRRSRCCWSPDRWGSTAQRARPGPGTPVRGGGGGVRAQLTLKINYLSVPACNFNPQPCFYSERTAELRVKACVVREQLCGQTHICGGHG